MKSILYPTIDSSRLFVAASIILISVLLIDGSLASIYAFIDSIAGPDEQYCIFIIIATTFVIGQYFILAVARNRVGRIKSPLTLPRIIHNINTLSSYFLSVILIVIIFEMFIESSYNTILLLLVLVVSYGLSCIALGLLAYRFFLWFKSRGSLNVLLYGISASVFVISNTLMMTFVSYVTPQVGDMIQPHGHLIMYFNNPGSPEYFMYNGYVGCSILSFILFWASTALILRHYSKRLGSIKYWILVSIPLVYFLSQFFAVFLSLFTSLMVQNPLVYGIILAVTFSISKSVGGILFGIAFWVMAKKTNQIATITDFLKIAAVGFMLLYVSERAVSLTSAPYPPFGLVSVATVGLASYLIMIALYYSAISLSNEMRTRKIILDSALQEFSLLRNIGFAQNEKEIENMVDKVVRKHSALIETKAAEIISPEEIKVYTTEVLNEVKKLKEHR